MGQYPPSGLTIPAIGEHQLHVEDKLKFHVKKDDTNQLKEQYLLDIKLSSDSGRIIRYTAHVLYPEVPETINHGHKAP